MGQVGSRHEGLVACENIGGYLAEPRSKAQADFLVTPLLANQTRQALPTSSLRSWACRPGGWACLTRATRAGGQGGLQVARWIWEHSVTDADYTNWAAGFPTPDDNLADCALMNGDFGWVESLR